MTVGDSGFAEGRSSRASRGVLALLALGLIALVGSVGPATAKVVTSSVGRPRCDVQSVGTGLRVLPPRPVASPSRIVFARSGDIYSMNPDGTDARNLTNSFVPCASDSEYPSWSPNGSRIAFTRRLGDRASTPPSQDLFTMNADGSGLVRVTDGEYDFDVAWSPDGKRIVYTQWPDIYLGVESVYGGLADPNGGIYVINASGTGEHEIHSDARTNGMSWSPDGTRIVFANTPLGAAGCDIYSMNPDGSDVRQLTHPAGSGCDGAPHYSPDGKQIAFTRGLGCACAVQLWLMNADGTNQRQLPGSGSVDWRPSLSWSPDGSRLVASGVPSPGGQPSVFRISIDGDDLTQLSNGAAFHCGTYCGDMGLTWGPAYQSSPSLAFGPGGVTRQRHPPTLAGNLRGG